MQLRRIAFILALAAAVGCGGGSNKKAKQPYEMDANELVRQSQSMLSAGRVTEALKSIDSAIAKEPDNPTMRHYRGLICFQSGRLDDAATAFESALALDSNYTDAHNFLGAVYNEQGRFADAEREFMLALEDPVYPTPEKVHFNLALLYENQGRDDEALKHLRRSVEINTKYYKAHYQLASLLDRTGELREAVSEYEVAAPGYLRNADYHQRLGFAYFRQGDKLKARESLRRAIDIAPGSESAARAFEVLELIE